MVESIGTSPLNGSGSVSRVAAPVATPAPQPAGQQQSQQAQAAQAPATQLSGLAKSLAASAPVNSERVTEIKKAIQNGSFPILPANIADRIIELKLNWDGHEKA